MLLLVTSLERHCTQGSHMAKRWTEEEDLLILKLREEGYTAKEITLRLPGRTYAAVRTRVAAISTDNKNKPWTEEEKQLVFQLKSEGVPNKAIARRIGRTDRAVTSFVSKYWHNSDVPYLDANDTCNE